MAEQRPANAGSIHDDRCATRKGHPCNCASAAMNTVSAHGNGCESCCYIRRPEGGHCYMFKEEPEVCFQHKYDHRLLEDAIEGVGNESAK